MKNQFNGKKTTTVENFERPGGEGGWPIGKSSKNSKDKVEQSFFFNIQKMTFLTKKTLCANFFLSRLIEAKSYFGKKVSTQKLEAWHQNLVGFET